ncbi:hypothetical protein VU04_02605 [Desulfobulbus sp. TB]|nr:hypothetical protein [Desulfobulbus sp. TB]
MAKIVRQERLLTRESYYQNLAIAVLVGADHDKIPRSNKQNGKNRRPKKTTTNRKKYPTMVKAKKNSRLPRNAQRRRQRKKGRRNTCGSS